MPTIGGMAVTMTEPGELTAEALEEREITEAAAPRHPAPMPSDRLRGWIYTGIITLIAGGLRLWGLSFPPGKIFDEIYYATEAHELLGQGYENNPGYMFIVHPPLGKWAIAVGEYFLGNNETGWRVSAAVAGTLAVLILIRLVRRMTRSTLLGCVAGVLLAVDGLSFSLSRVALLDIFLQFFVLAGFACLVVDRDRVRDRLSRLVDSDTAAGFGPGVGPRGWRLAGGILLGLACAVKWSGIYFLVGFALLSLIWDRSARRAAGISQPTLATAARDLPGGVISLGIAPVLAYLASWTGWFLGENSYGRHWAEGRQSSWSFIPAPIRSLWHYHAEMLHFHNNLTSTHPYKSSPWSWLVDGRPVSFYYPADQTGCGAEHCARQVFALGTPALWWAFIPALVWMLWVLITRRDWRAGAVLMAFAAGWGTWMINLKRTMFVFYMAPLVPFLIIGIVLLLGDVLGPAHASNSRRRIGLGVISGFVALVVVNFAWLYPLFTGGLLTYDQWYARMWFQSWI